MTQHDHKYFSTLYEQAIPFCLIDCRERRDYVNGHWFGSTNIPLSILPTRLPFLCPDQDFPIHFLIGGTRPALRLCVMEKMDIKISRPIKQPNQQTLWLDMCKANMFGQKHLARL